MATWQEKLEQAKTMALTAAKDFSAAADKLVLDLRNAHSVAKEAMEEGGTEARTEWFTFVKEQLSALFKHTVQSVKDAISEFSEEIDWVHNKWIYIGVAVFMGGLIWYFVK